MNRGKNLQVKPEACAKRMLSKIEFYDECPVHIQDKTHKCRNCVEEVVRWLENGAKKCHATN